MFMITSWVPVK